MRELNPHVPGDYLAQAMAETAPRDWLIRFAFGAGVSTLAGIVSAVAGPRMGGMFLAFAAILLASLTLVAKEDGVRQARNEARGATFGTVGLFGFAGCRGRTRWPVTDVGGVGCVQRRMARHRAGRVPG